MAIPRNMQHAALGLALASCLCACASERAPPVVHVPAHYDGAVAGAPLASAELDQWWVLFKDPQLDALEDEAFRYSPDARTAAARLLEARATAGSQTAQTLPTGDIAGNISRQTSRQIGGSSNNLFPIGGVTTSRTANLDVSWEIDLFGRLKEARRVARANFAASQFDIDGVTASLAASVADQYFQARGLAIQLDDAEATAKIERELEDTAAEKARVGLGAASDADRVAGDLAQADAQVESLKAQLHAAERQLLILVGRPFEPTASLPIDASVYPPPPIPAAVPGALLSRRPDVREAEEKFRAEAGTAKLRHLAIFPTFTILPGLGGSSVTQPGVGFRPPATLFQQQQTTSLGFWTIGGGVTVPLLDIPRLLYDAKAEDARTQEAAIAYEKTVQTAYGESENDLIALAAAERGAAGLDAGEARARRAYEDARELYGRGLTDITTALSAEQAWRATRSALTSARVQALREAVAAYKALGGGWDYTHSAGRIP